MIALQSSSRRLTACRPETAAQRSDLAAGMLSACRFCAHDCGADRCRGPVGPCRAGTAAKFFSAQVELGDELDLVPVYALALSGCNMRCDFCITGQSSWNAKAGALFEPLAAAAEAAEAVAQGARSVMLLGGEPTIHLPAVLRFIAAMPPEARLVCKTNAFFAEDARALLEDMFDVWVCDYKFGNDDCALKLARAQAYQAVVRENLVWAHRHSQLVVRHLLMPGHLRCCWYPVAAWLASELPGVKVSLGLGFWPGWQSGRHPELRRTTSEVENGRALEIAADFGLTLVT